jgi:hypothetical protein
MLNRRLLPLSLLIAALGCGHEFLPPPDRQVHGDQRPIPARPEARDPSLANEILEMTFGHQLKQILDAPRAVRKLSGRPYEAINVDNFDEVPNSTWFTHRNGREPMSLAAIRQGPDRTGPPSAEGPWKIVALKCAGVTPGMTIVDARGERYIIKFDPPDFPELPSGTEVVASKLLYAAGYNVPENYIAFLDPDRLEIGAGTTVKVETNDKRDPIETRPMVREDLERALQRVMPGGPRRIRVLASRFLPGIPVGPWRYTGVREDDPNDLYPHEHRREVRGLYIIASWINHADMKEENTLDTYDPERRILTHYLLDFGASMGSNSTTASNPRRGQANSFDLKDSLMRLGTLGLYVHGYEKAPRTIRYPSVGYLENDLFKPHKWKPMYPVPAFENLTRRDAFWGTRIVTSFTDAQIETAVSAGQFSNPDAAAYMVRFLIERRDRIGRYWFARVNPLDRFACATAASVRFADLAAERGYAEAGRTRYLFEVLDAEGKTLAEGQTLDTRLDLEEAWKRHAFVAVSLLPQRPGLEAEPVLVYLVPEKTGWKVAGLRRCE